MSGGIRYDPGGGGPPPITSFSDTLIGVDRPFYIGNQYYLVGLADSTNAPVDWAAQLNIGGTGLTYGSGSGINNNGMNCNAFPSSIDYAATVSRSIAAGLFAQFTIVSKTAGIDASVGVFLLGNPGTSVCYFTQIHSQDNIAQLFRKNGGAGFVVLVANLFLNAPGDIVRHETQYIGANVQIKSYLNGVLQNTFLDNIAPIGGGGVFGLSFTGVFTGQVTISNFSGGGL
jgi:hypothetical protein